MSVTTSSVAITDIIDTPELRSLTIARSLPDRSYVRATLQIRGPGKVGGLSPGFSLTGELYEAHGTWPGRTCFEHGRDIDAGGQITDYMRRAFGARLEPFARVHLADLDGTPMYGEANARYFLSGESDAYELRQYGPDYLKRNGSGYERAARILRVDTIPAACIANPGERMVGDELAIMRDIIGPAWAAFIAERREAWAYDAWDAVRTFDHYRAQYAQEA